MLSLKNKILAAAIISGVLVFASIFVLSFGQKNVQGSVVSGSEYFATSTRSFTGTNNITNFTVLSNYNGCTATCPGTVGSVVITGANTGIVRLWDATTTDVTKRIPGTATSTLTFIEIPTNTATGTYTYDVNFNSGILYELVSGEAATSSITWRNR